MVIGTFELKREKKLLPVYGRMILYLLLSAVLLIILGVLSVLIFSPERIPILIEEEIALQIPGFKEILLSLFPENLFQVLVGGGHFLLPVIVLAFLLGINLNFDLRLTSPVVQLFDALNRVFYHINSLLAELFGLAMVVIAASSMIVLGHEDFALFKQILIILGIDSGLIIFAIYQGLLYLLGGRTNPYRWLYAVIGPALTAFFTRDEYLAIGMLVKHGKENLGVPRRVGTAVYPLFAFFGRAGTALVTSASFLLVLSSYSSLEITMMQVFTTCGFTLLISLALGSVPGMGAFVALSMLCSVFGKGLQEGYLILKPIAPLLISFGVLLDVVTSAFVSLLISKHEDVWDDIDPSDYV
jgi:Na+/H+-dicarboxylate symporter